jgi:hypothetical protein
MGKIFFVFGLLIVHNIFIPYSSASSISFYKSQRKAYNKYCTDPTEQKFNEFWNIVSNRFRESPLEWIRSLERGQGDWKFTLLCLRALFSLKYVDPKTITDEEYPELLELLIDRIRKLLLKFWFNKVEFEQNTKIMVTILMGMAEKTFLKLKVRSNAMVERFKNFGQQVEVWRFLLRNLPNNIIDGVLSFNSLYKIMDRIEAIKLNSNSSDSQSLTLSKYTALLGIYLYKNCIAYNESIFAVNNHQRPIFFYLMFKMSHVLPNTYNAISQEFVPGLEDCIQELYPDGKSLDLDPIVKLLTDPHFKRRYQNKGGLEAERYREMFHFANQRIFLNRHILIAADLRALAEIEFFLMRRGRKIY